MWPSRLCRRRGFGLIEVMVALVVVVIVIGATGVVVRQANRVTYNFQDRVVAGGLAQEVMEVIRNWRDRNPGSDLDDLDTNDHYFNNPVKREVLGGTGSGAPEVTRNGLRYTFGARIDRSATNPNPYNFFDYWKVLVEVRWTDNATGENQLFSISTILEDKRS